MAGEISVQAGMVELGKILDNDVNLVKDIIVVDKQDGSSDIAAHDLRGNAVETDGNLDSGTYINTKEYGLMDLSKIATTMQVGFMTQSTDNKTGISTSVVDTYRKVQNAIKQLFSR